MSHLRIVVATGLLFFAILAIYIVSNGKVERAQTSAEAADLSDAQLAVLKEKAIDSHDAKAAARIYWYYRITKKDFTEAKKWRWAVVTPPYSPDDDGLP